MEADAKQQALSVQIHQAGLKVTAPRLAVLGVLNNKGHFDAETILKEISPALPKASLQAVYGVLGAFVTAGLVRKIEPAGSPALYEVRVGDNHHHMVCLNCRTVADVDCAIGESPCLAPSDLNGFAVQSAEVTYWGLCSVCQSAQDVQSAQEAPATA